MTRPVPYLCTSIEGFVGYLAASLIPRGYKFFVQGRVPAGKDPLRVDRKLIERYGANASKWTRAHRKANGLCNVRYLRLDDVFLLIATRGAGRFFEDERPRSCERTPIRLFGYAVSFKPDGRQPGRMRAHVRIEDRQHAELKAFFLEMATKRPAEWLERELGRLPFEPFAPVKKQVFQILSAVNEKRLRACLPLLSKKCVRVRKQAVRPFG